MDKMDAYFEHLEKIQKKRTDMLNTYCNKPEELNDLLTKLINSDVEFIDSDSYLYKDNVALSEDEFYELFEVLNWFFKGIGKSYNAQNLSEDELFPTETGHMIFMGKVVTVETVHGQGSLRMIRVESIDLAENTDIPMSAFSEFVKSAKGLMANASVINQNNAQINEIEDAIETLLQLIETQVSANLEKTLRKTIDKMEDEIKQIEEVNKSYCS